MDPYERDRNRRRRNPFDSFGFDDEFFDGRIADDIRRMFEEMMRMASKASPGKTIVHGYKYFVGPDGKPHFEDFGNKPVKSDEGQSSISEEREPLTDVIDCGEDVSVTVELPGVEKEDIDLNVTEDQLEITVFTPQRKYHKMVDLPAEVKPKTTKATYKNGILDVIIQKKELKKDAGKGFKVNIQ